MIPTRIRSYSSVNCVTTGHSTFSRICWALLPNTAFPVGDRRRPLITRNRRSTVSTSERISSGYKRVIVCPCEISGGFDDGLESFAFIDCCEDYHTASVLLGLQVDFAESGPTLTGYRAKRLLFELCCVPRYCRNDRRIHSSRPMSPLADQSEELLSQLSEIIGDVIARRRRLRPVITLVSDYCRPGITGGFQPVF